MPRRINQLSFFGLVVLILISIGSAVAATNTVPSSRLTDQRRAITANDLKPAACAGLNLTTVITGSGLIQGTNGNDLLLGSAGDDKLQGKAGDDCIIGGGGMDDFNGTNGTDVCIGLGGDDTFLQCETVIP
jgi:Ca2+-binding RTX toxin-like protein